MDFNFLLEGLKTLYFIAICQFMLLVIFLLFNKKGNAAGRKVLAILLIDTAIFLSGTYLLLFFRNVTIWKIAHLANLTVFLATPLLYFYYLSLIVPDFKLKTKMLLHAIPFLITMCIMAYEIFMKSNHKFMFKPYGIALLFGLYIQNIIYIAAVYNQKRRVDLQSMPSQSPVWFNFIFRSIMLVFALKLIIFLIWNVFGWVDVCIFFTGLFFILSFILINMLVFFSLINPNMLIHHVKYQNTPIDKSLSDECFHDIVHCLSSDLLFKDSLLNLHKLSRHLNVSEKRLSQIINEQSGDNFNDFVNKYRIREAQRLLTQNSGKNNILQIAYEVGFNSKSTFNTTFKKHTGITPSLYRKTAAACS